MSALPGGLGRLLGSPPVAGTGRALLSSLLAAHPLLGGLIHLPVGLWQPRPDPWLGLFALGSGLWATGQLDHGVGMFLSILAQGVGGWLCFRAGQRLLPHWSYAATLAGVSAYAFIRWLDRPYAGYQEQLWSFNPNALGAWLAMGGAISILMVRPGWLGLAGYLASGLGIWATGSRSSAGAWLLAGLLALAIRLPRRWRRLAIGGLAFALVLGVLAGNVTDLGRFGAPLGLDAPDTQVRVEIYRVAWQALLQSPLVGVASFSQYFQANMTDRARELGMTGQPHAHNLLLHALAEGGLLAGLGLAIWLGGASWLLVTARAWPGLAVLAVAMLLNVFDFTFATAEVYFPLWIAIGWSLAATGPRGQAQGSDHDHQRSMSDNGQPAHPTRVIGT